MKEEEEEKVAISIFLQQENALNLSALLLYECVQMVPSRTFFLFFRRSLSNMQET